MYTGGPYFQIPARLPSGYCIKCRKLFQLGDRYHPIFIVTAIDGHFSGVGRALYVSKFTEFSHFDCARPSGNPIFHEGRRPSRLDASHPDMLPIQESRTPSYVCAICRKEFKIGDRTVQVLISGGTCIDPQSKHPNMVGSPNFEAVHAVCPDPQLTMTGVLILTGD